MFFDFIKIIEVVPATDENFDQSRVVIKVGDVGRDGINLRPFALFDNTFDENGDLSNIGKHFYQFPIGAKASANSIVRVFVKKGKDHGWKNDDGTQYFDFYWGREAAIWNENDTAKLIRLTVIDSKSV